MRRREVLLIGGLVVAAILAGCGGGSSTNKVPDSFPKDFPIYKGATVTFGIPGGVFWQTGDSIDKVKDFYNGAFKDGPWKADSQGVVRLPGALVLGCGSSSWSGQSNDGKQAFYLRLSTAGDKTSIVAIVGDTRTGDATPSGTPADCGSSSEQTATAGCVQEPMSYDKLSDRFPKDFPIYKGAKLYLSTGARPATPCNEGVSASWKTRDALDKVTDFYYGAFKQDPWKADSPGELDFGSHSDSTRSVRWCGQSSDGKHVWSLALYQDDIALGGVNGGTAIHADLYPNDASNTENRRLCRLPN